MQGRVVIVGGDVVFPNPDVDGWDECAVGCCEDVEGGNDGSTTKGFASGPVGDQGNLPGDRVLFSLVATDYP